MTKGWCAAACSLLALAIGERVARPAPAGVGDFEEVRLEEVAPEERGARADSPAPPLAPLPAGAGAGPASSERDEAAALAEELRGLWRRIPAYSPVNGTSRLTSGFGWRESPFTGRREFHGGIDLAGPRGTPVVAPADGVVERVLRDEASGRVVVLGHGNGMETIYAHLDSVGVAAGEAVARGQALGTLGSSGWRSTGPHLHYGVKVATKYVNPRRYLFERTARRR